MLAELNFLRPMAGPPVLDLTGGNESEIKLDKRQVEFTDADSLDPPPSLATHGFTAVPFEAAAPAGDGDPQFRRQFANLCAAAIKQATGAALVFGLPDMVFIRRGTGTGEDMPISVVHNDFTPRMALQRAGEALGFLPAHVRPRPLRRFAAFNAWWLASEGPQDRPLALCDATSIAPADLLFGRANVPTYGDQPVHYGEIAFQRHSARQRFYWYRRLASDRLLVFCGFDSDSSMPSMVTHGSFTNPECPAGAPPRLSVECRCFAFW